MTSSPHFYEVHPRKDRHVFGLISDALPFGRLWYLDAAAAFGYAKFYSRSHDAVIGIYEAGKMIETHEQASELREW